MLEASCKPCFVNPMSKVMFGYFQFLRNQLLEIERPPNRAVSTPFLETGYYVLKKPII